MKHCLECQKPVLGRSDKKFCDDGCRNTFNNRRNSETNKYMKDVNGLLKKNRRILQSLLHEDDKISISEKTLKVLGLNFEYYTHVYETKKGSIYKFCYEFGYLKINDGVYMVVRQRPQR